MVTLDEATGRGMYEGQQHAGQGWTHMFSADGHAFYKTPEMVRLNAEFGDKHSKITGKSTEIRGHVGN